MFRENNKQGVEQRLELIEYCAKKAAHRIEALITLTMSKTPIEA